MVRPVVLDQSGELVRGAKVASVEAAGAAGVRTRPEVAPEVPAGVQPAQTWLVLEIPSAVPTVLPCSYSLLTLVVEA